MFGYYEILLPGLLKLHVLIPLLICLVQFVIAALPYTLRHSRFVQMISLRLLVETFVPLAKALKAWLFTDSQEEDPFGFQ